MTFLSLPIIEQIYQGLQNEVGKRVPAPGSTPQPTATKTTNQAILNALVSLGFAGAGTISTYGAQSREFRDRVLSAGVHPVLFDAAMTLAKGGVPDAEAIRTTLEADQYQPPPRLVGGEGAMVRATDTGNLLAGATKAQPAPTPLPAPLPMSLSQGEQGGPAAYQSVPSVAAPKPLSPAELRSRLEAQYGWAAGLADVPEIQGILTDYSNGLISDAEVLNRFRSTDYYKTTTETERNWKILQRSDPAEAAAVHAAQHDNLRAVAQKLGAELGEERLVQLTDISLRYGWDDAQVQRFLASEIRFDPTGSQTGVLKAIQDQAREFLVPLSSESMTAWAQSIVGGTRTAEDYQAYLRDMAKSMFPALGTALDDPNMTTRKYLDPYGQTIAKTLGVNAADIDWTQAKYSRFVNQIDPKTNQRSVMSLADVSRTLMADPQYGWDQTAEGQATKADLSRTMLKTLGFSA